MTEEWTFEELKQFLLSEIKESWRDVMLQFSTRFYNAHVRTDTLEKIAYFIGVPREDIEGIKREAEKEAEIKREEWKS